MIAIHHIIDIVEELKKFIKCEKNYYLLIKLNKLNLIAFHSG